MELSCLWHSEQKRVKYGRFKNHFGIWFFNGVFLKDEQILLENAQAGKPKPCGKCNLKKLNILMK